MSANPIIYCLESLTDYRQFERLCSDLMAGVGFRKIEPIGGTGDRGRDAVHCSKTDDNCTIFAYSVRADWLVKLRQDCKRIHEEQHKPNDVVFVCTAALSGSDKDSAKEKVRTEFGWSLEIYDIERIRVLLAGDLRHLIAQHPTIFCPPWFPTKGGLTIADSKDTLIIDHLSVDHSLATWLSRRLSIAGYRTWCYGISPLVGEDKDESIRVLIDSRAAQYLPIISLESFKDTDFIGRASSAIRTESFVLPCWAANMEDIVENSKILQVEPARFDSAWSVGLKGISEGLHARGIKAAFDEEKGQAIALRAYMPEPVTKAVSEKLYANVFPVTVPNAILVCELSKGLEVHEIDELRASWAFVKVTPTRLLSFDRPPANVPLINALSLAEYSWASYPFREGKKSINVVKELVRRSLNVACVQAGLALCIQRNVYYFTELENKQRNVSFVHMDGRKTHVAVTGTKQDGWGDRATKFRYQLSPSFRVEQDEDGAFWVTTRVYVRVTNLNGEPFQDKEIIRKRKKVTKNWWNKEWLARTIGVMQGLANNTGKDAIEVGSEDKRKVIVLTRPLEWDCPISIDVEAVDRIGDFQEEMANARYFDEGEIPPSGNEKERGSL